ncbi:MAG: leucine-rich repeat domain-containing protein [Bacteroidales bacterium]|nr:leucine-rich repeat domain-containing protein [Bacteroidales bacterium]
MYNKLKIILFAASLACCTIVKAHDHEEITRGVKIFYNITSSTNKTVEVTYRGTDTSMYQDRYTGKVFIPPSVTIDGFKYKVTAVGKNAFVNCGQLQEVVLPATVEEIKEQAFLSSGLTTVTLPKNVTSIGQYAFAGCINLQSVKLPKSLNQLSSDAFYMCRNLSDIAIDKSNKNFSVDDKVLYTYTKDTLLLFPSNHEKTVFDIPATVKVISRNAFVESKLATVLFPYTLTEIQDYAFVSCMNLTALTLSGNISKLTGYSFVSCQNINKIEVESGNRNFVTYNDILYSSDRKTLVYYAPGKSSTMFNIPSYVRTIGNGAFHCCQNLKTVVMPSSVVYIGYGAFESCVALSSVTLSDSLSVIGEYAFANCDKLEKIHLPIKLLTLRNDVFYDCDRLQNVEIFEDTKYTKAKTFSNCSKNLVIETYSRPKETEYKPAIEPVTVKEPVNKKRNKPAAPAKEKKTGKQFKKGR